jgi:hypothetical protein
MLEKNLIAVVLLGIKIVQALLLVLLNIILELHSKQVMRVNMHLLRVIVVAGWDTALMLFEEVSKALVL